MKDGSAWKILKDQHENFDWSIEETSPQDNSAIDEEKSLAESNNNPVELPSPW
jgi:hypothetical protein